MHKQIIATGSLYLDREETLQYALESVARMAAQNPTEYYFDVICRVDQIEYAGKCMTRIANEISDKCPQVIDEAKHFGITTDEWIRPGMMNAAKSASKEGGNLDTIDLNPERKPR